MISGSRHSPRRNELIATRLQCRDIHEQGSVHCPSCRSISHVSKSTYCHIGGLLLVWGGTSQTTHIPHKSQRDSLICSCPLRETVSSHQDVLENHLGSHVCFWEVNLIRGLYIYIYISGAPQSVLWIGGVGMVLSERVNGTPLPTPNQRGQTHQFEGDSMPGQKVFV